MDFYRKQKFSIRKLSLGVASVLIGMSLVFGGQTVKAQENMPVNQNASVSSEVRIDYLAVDQADLTVLESQLMTHQAISEEQAVADDVYVLVYQKKQEVAKRLPQTGSEAGLVGLAVAGGLFVVAYRLGKKKSVLLGVAVLGTAGQLALMNGVQATELLQSIATHVSSYARHHSLKDLSLDGYDYVGYIRDESIPENTNLYRLVEAYKASGVKETPSSAFSTYTYPVDVKDDKSDSVQVSEAVISKDLSSDNKTPDDKAENSRAPISDSKTESKVDTVAPTPVPDNAGKVEESFPDTSVIDTPTIPESTTDTDLSTSTPDSSDTVEESFPDTSVIDTPTIPESMVDTDLPTLVPDSSGTVEETVPDTSVTETPTIPESTVDTDLPAPVPDNTGTVEESLPDTSVIDTPTIPESTTDTEVPTPMPDSSGTVEESVSDTSVIDTPTIPDSASDTALPTPASDSSGTVEESLPDTSVTDTPTNPESTTDTEVPAPVPDNAGTVEETVPDTSVTDTPTNPESTSDTEVPTPAADSSGTVEETVPDTSVIDTPTIPESTVDTEVPAPALDNTGTVEESFPDTSVIDTPTIPESTTDTVLPAPAADSSGTVEESVPDTSVTDTPTNPESTTDTEVPAPTPDSSGTVEGGSDTGTTETIEEELNLAEVTAVQEKISLAKDKVLEVQLKKTALESDGLVTPSEHDELAHMIAIATTVYQDAVSALAALPTGDDKMRLGNQLTGLVIPTLPVVNDENSNGTVDRSGDVETVATQVQEAKAKAAEATAKHAEIMRDGVINPTEKTALDALIAAATQLTSEAQTAIIALPPSDRRTALQAELSGISIPKPVAVNDNNSNGTVDTSGDVETVSTQIQEAKAKAAEATAKRGEIMQDGVVNPSEKTALDTLIEAATQLTSEAQTAITALPISDRRTELETELSGISIPKSVNVNDENSNGKVDTAGDIETVATQVQTAKAKAAEVTDKRAEITQDGVINPTEKTAFNNLIAAATQLKSSAQSAVTALPPSDRRTALQAELSGITIPETVVVNDSDSNGKVDTAGDVETVATKVQAAKAKAAEATAKHAEITQDGVINPSDKTALDSLISAATQLTSAAQNAITALPPSDRRTELQAELSGITIPETVVVNDSDSNGTVDRAGAVETVATQVQEAKAKAADATAKRAEITQDGVINPSEKTALDTLIEAATQLTSSAQSAIIALPPSDRRTALQAELSGITIPETVVVNDSDSNGTVDRAGAVETVATPVQEAKAKAAEATAKRVEIMSDGVVNPTEKTALDTLIAAATQLKSSAQSAIAQLPPSDRRTELEAELSKISIPETVAVNDDNSNGKVDTAGNVDEASAKIAVAKAKIAEAVVKHTAIHQDKIITPDEKSAFDDLLAQASYLKTVAQETVNGLQDSDRRDALLAELSHIAIPEPVDVTEEEPVEEVLTETRVALKNVDNAFLYRLNANNEYEKVLSIDQVDQDLSHYKVKAFLTDANKYVWLDVRTITADNDEYRVETSLDRLFGNQLRSVTPNNYSIKVARRNAKEVNEYTSFAKLIEAMKQASQNGIVNGTYIIADHLTASELSLEDNAGSYLDNYTFSGTLKSKDGSVFSITDLKKPLLDSTSHATIANIHLKDVDVTGLKSSSVGSLANTASETQIHHVSVTGTVRGNDWVGGIVGLLDNNSTLENVSYRGSIASLHSAGGLTGNTTRGSRINHSYAEVHMATSARLQDAIGGISGQLNQDASIENTYVRGSIYNNGEKRANVGGTIGAAYGFTNDKGRIHNVVSNVTVTNGHDFVGNWSELLIAKEISLQNNAVVTSKQNLVASNDDNKLRYIDQATADSMTSGFYQDVAVKPFHTNKTEVIYHNVPDYRSSHQKAYENVAKLLPFYNRYTIVREANRLAENDSLNTKTISSIQTFAGDQLVKDLYREKNQVSKLLISYTDHSKETLDLTFKGAFEQTGILDYTIAGKNITYHLNRLAQDRRAIVDAVAGEFASLEYDYTLFNPHNLAEWDIPGRNSRLGKLYLEDHFATAKEAVVNDLSALVDQYDIADYTQDSLRQHLEAKIRQHKKQMLVGMNYLERWYTFSNVKNRLLYALDSYRTPHTSLDMLIEIGSQTIDTLASNLTDSAYEQVLAKYTGKANINTFVEDAYRNSKTAEQVDIDTWLKQATRAYLINTTSSTRSDANETIFERLTSLHHRHWLLPLLTVKDEHVYGFFTTNSSNMGIFDPYVSASKGTTQYREQLEATKRKVDETAVAMQGYFDALYRILEPASVEKLLDTKIQVFDSYRNHRGTWSREYGSKAFDSIKAFVGPIRRWDSETPRASAYAFNRESIETVHYSSGDLLSSGGWSTLTHEHVHNLDKKVLLKGYGRRFGHGAESFAMGLLQTPRTSSDTMGINLVYDIGSNEKHLLMHNSGPKRFQSAEDLQQYMKGVFDVLYTLDLAEAEVILEKGWMYIQNNYKKLGSGPGYGSAKSDVITYLSGLNKMTSINDLIDAQVVGPKVPLKTYGNDDYIEVDMFSSHYGINENPTGSSGGLTLRRVAFELLAEKGYYDGMVPYISNQYYFEEGSDKETSKSDSYILNKIFNGEYKTFKDFRKAMFEKRKARIGELKSVNTWTFGTQRQQINSYADIKKLIERAIDKDDWHQVNNIKRNIYQAYLLATDEFRESIYKKP